MRVCSLPRPGRVTVRLVLAALLSACGPRLEVPAPARLATPPAPPEPEASIVSIPLTVELADLLEQLEDAAPRGRAQEDEWHPLGRAPVLGMLYLKERWEREPLRIALSGSSVAVTARVRYRARVAERACLPGVGCRWVPLAGCGHDGPMPSLQVGLVTRVRWRDDWSLAPSTAAVPVQAGTRCRLTAARIDVTDRVRQAAQSALDSVAPRVDRELRRRADLREPLAEVWRSLQEPVKAADSVYLQFRPEAVEVAPLASRGSRLATVVSLRVRPRVVVGPRPDAAPLPLPPLRVGQRTSGFRISFIGEMDYGTASRLVNDVVAGRRIEMPAGRSLRIAEVRLYGNGTQLVARVGVTGDARGTVYLVGTPVYDGARREVWIPDLDFSVESRDVLTRAASWMLHERLRDRLREAARFPVGDRLDRLHGLVNQALHRPLGGSVRLDGRIEAWRVRGIMVTRGGIATLGEAQGEARVRVTLR